MHLNGNGRTGIRSILENFADHRDHQVPSFSLPMIRSKATIDCEETTFKWAKCTEAARDPADLPDSVSPRGILEGRQKHHINNILTFCRPESRDSLKNTVISLRYIPYKFLFVLFLLFILWSPKIEEV